MNSIFHWDTVGVRRGALTISGLEDVIDGGRRRRTGELRRSGDGEESRGNHASGRDGHDRAGWNGLQLGMITLAPPIKWDVHAAPAVYIRIK